MKIFELIEQLKKLPKDLEVFTEGYEGGYDTIEAGSIRLMDFAKRGYESGYEGSYEEFSNTFNKEEEKINGVLLSRYETE